MQLKDFLLEKKDRFEGKELLVKETLSPAAKNFLTREWLIKIDCIWPPNNSQSLQQKPNFRVLLCPEEDNHEYFNDEAFSSQFETLFRLVEGCDSVVTML